MLLTGNSKLFDPGDLKGDLGKTKALTALVRNTVNMFGSYNVGMVCTNHICRKTCLIQMIRYPWWTRFYLCKTIVVAMRKLKLKEDEDGNKISQVKGIRAACKVMKTRYAKPFESVQVKIPYETGMNPYSGLVDLAEATGLLTKQGNRLAFKTSSGEDILQFRKAWERNEEGCLDKVMADFNIIEEVLSTPEEVTEVPDTVEEEKI